MSVMSNYTNFIKSSENDEPKTWLSVSNPGLELKSVGLEDDIVERRPYSVSFDKAELY